MTPVLSCQFTSVDVAAHQVAHPQLQFHRGERRRHHFARSGLDGRLKRPRIGGDRERDRHAAQFRIIPHGATHLQAIPSRHVNIRDDCLEVFLPCRGQGLPSACDLAQPVIRQLISYRPPDGFVGLGNENSGALRLQPVFGKLLVHGYR